MRNRWLVACACAGVLPLVGQTRFVPGPPFGVDVVRIGPLFVKVIACASSTAQVDRVIFNRTAAVRQAASCGLACMDAEGWIQCVQHTPSFD